MTVAFGYVKKGEAHNEPSAVSRLGVRPSPRPNTGYVVPARWKILSVPERAFRMTSAAFIVMSFRMKMDDWIASD